MKKNIEKVIASDHDSHASMTLLAFFIPIVGFVVGVVYLTKNEVVDRKLGEHMVVVSILGSILAVIAYYYLLPMLAPGTYFII